MEKKVSDIGWSNFKTAYGSAEAVEKQLALLTSPILELAMKASHDLWCGLCHQHDFISSAALPAYPFLISAFKQADEKLQVELLDIFSGFVVCLNRLENYERWQLELLKCLQDDAPLFMEAQTSENKNIASYADEILLNLDSSK